MDDRTMTLPAETAERPKRPRAGRKAPRTSRPASKPTTSESQADPVKSAPTPAPRYTAARPRPIQPVTPAPGADRAEGGPSPRPPLTRAEGLRILVERANGGSASALAALRELLTKCPEIWQSVGDLSRQAEFAWSDLISGGDRLVTEAAKCHLEDLKARLAGASPTPVERLLIDLVGVTWLGVQYSEMALATPGTCSAAEGNYRLRRAESCQRRHLAALRTLATLRALVPAGLSPAPPETASTAPTLLVEDRHIE